MAKYKFIGTHGSMGYVAGKVYRGNIVAVRYDGSVLFVTGRFPMHLFNPCIPYASMAKFNENWQEV